MNRFKWIGNSMLRIMNHHGLELLVHIDYIDCDFKLLAYNLIDNFNWDWDTESPYYKQRWSLKAKKVDTVAYNYDEGVERLRRHCQNYKSALIFNKHEKAEHAETAAHLPLPIAQSPQPAPQIYPPYKCSKG